MSEIVSQRRKIVWRLIVIIFICAVLAGGGYGAWRAIAVPQAVVAPEMITVTRERFVHEILERGNVESAQNIEIRCAVESSAGLTIISLVPEGTTVKKGDLLVEFDSSLLSDSVTKQQIVANNSAATMAKSEADFRNAELSLKEYTEGKYLHELKVIDDKIFVAREEARLAEDNVRFNQKLLERGYLTESQAEADQIAFRKAVNARESAELEKEVLTQFTYEKNVRTYTSAVESARAKSEADLGSNELDLSRLEHLKTQLSRCRILAPQDGQVVYFIPRWGGEDDIMREGRKVNERQILMRLPDPTQMQVKGLVNEASIRLVKPGQRASVNLEAFPNRTFAGVVERVNDYPEPGGSGSGTMSREYQTVVRMLDPPEGIKPGLTAEVLITVNEITDALVLPVQSVFRYHEKQYCMTFESDSTWGMRELDVITSNDKKVVIRSGVSGGVSEGDRVVLGAWQHRKHLNLPPEPVPENNDHYPEPEDDDPSPAPKDDDPDPAPENNNTGKPPTSPPPVTAQG